jgi:hypothetical protein
MREAKTLPVAVEVDVETYLQQRQTQLQEQLQTVNQLVAKDKLPEVRLEKGKFHFTQLKTDQPEGMMELTRRAYALLPPIKITDLLLDAKRRLPPGSAVISPISNQATGLKIKSPC